MNIRLAAFALLIASGAVSTAIAPASADEVFVVGPHGVPAYTVWRPEWDSFHADRHHVILGTVAGFEPTAYKSPAATATSERSTSRTVRSFCRPERRRP